MTRLVLITGSTYKVYEGRKLLATYEAVEGHQINAAQVEQIRVARSHT